MNRRLPLAVRRRITWAVIALALAWLAAEALVTGHLTVSAGGVPAVVLVTGVFYLFSPRGRS